MVEKEGEDIPKEGAEEGDNKEAEEGDNKEADDKEAEEGDNKEVEDKDDKKEETKEENKEEDIEKREEIVEEDLPKEELVKEGEPNEEEKKEEVKEEVKEEEKKGKKAPGKKVPKKKAAKKNPEDVVALGVFEAVNKLRTEPKYYVALLEKYKKCFEGTTCKLPNHVPVPTKEGVKTVGPAIAELKKTAPMGVLEWSEPLAQASKHHVTNIGVVGHYSHQGTDGSQVVDRVSRFCKWNGRVSENLDFVWTKPEEIVCWWLLHDGKKERPYRKNILRPSHKFAGVGYGPHTKSRHCCCLVLADTIEEDANAANKPLFQPKQGPKIVLKDKQGKEMEDLPKGTVKVDQKMSTRMSGNQKIITTTTTYTKKDGSIEEKKETRTEEIV